MLRWALFFLIFAVLASLFGFGDISIATKEIARFIFFLFLVLFVIMLALGLASGGRKPPNS